MQGTLKGCDARANIILADCVEREYSLDEGVNMIPLGLYMIKGDNLYVFTPSLYSLVLTDFRVMIGEVDADKEASLDYKSIRAEPLNEIRF